MTKIFFTGGTGFIGRLVVEKLLLNNQNEIYILTRNKNLINCVVGKIIYIYGDIADTIFINKCLANVRPNVLFHFAWDVQSTDYATNEINNNWSTWTNDLIAAFLYYGGKTVIAAGTCLEYGLKNNKCLLVNDSHYLPTSLYGKAKLKAYGNADKLCKKYHARLVWGRIFFSYGIGENKRKFITATINTILNNKKYICNNPNNCIDYIHVSDVANLIYLCYINKSIVGTVNIGTGKGYRLNEIIDMIGEICGKHHQIKYNNKEKRGLQIVSDNSLLSKLHYKPTDIVNNIKNMITYLSKSKEASYE